MCYILFSWDRNIYMQKRSRCITNNGDNVKNDLYSKTVKTRSSIKGMIKRKLVSMMFHLTISFLSILQKETSNFDVSRKIWNKHFPGHWIFQSLSSYQNFCWNRVYNRTVMKNISFFHKWWYEGSQLIYYANVLYYLLFWIW